MDDVVMKDYELGVELLVKDQYQWLDCAHAIACKQHRNWMTRPRDNFFQFTEKCSAKNPIAEQTQLKNPKKIWYYSYG